MDQLIRLDARRVIENLGVDNQRFAGKRVLLTGAAGFLGAHFVHYFAELNDAGALERPVRLLALDSFIRGEPDWVTGFGSRPDVEFRAADVTARPELEGDFDFVIHAASIASPTYYRKHPIETMDANVIGLRWLLDRAVRRPVESMLFFSTSEIYGDPSPEDIPTPETYRGFVSCTGPRACYDESKRFGETLCVSFWQVNGVPVKTARPFNNYGPALKLTDRRVIPDFFRSILHGEDIRMFSDGSPTRTFCYISDAISGYVKMLLSEHNGEAFNIGAAMPEISMRELAELCVRVADSSSKVIVAPSGDRDYLTDNPQRRCPDVRKARELLAFEAKVGLEEGLTHSYNWYRSVPEGQEA